LHPWHNIDRGRKTPNEIVAVIEIPLGSNVKYELGQENGRLNQFNKAQVILSIKRAASDVA
jgi:inorganic pyrophosphatase